MNAFWAQRNPREKFLIVICVIAVLVGVPMLLLPSQAANKKLLPAAQARQKYQEASKQKDALEAESSRMKAQTDAMVYTDAPEQVIPKLIRTLQGYAKASGLHLREIKPLRAKELAGVTKVPVSVRFTTSEFQKSVVPFLYRIEDPSGKLVVEKCTVSAADPKTRNVDVEVQIALFTVGGQTGGTAGANTTNATAGAS